ncbi:hypothetical protein [Granulosicoccus antarcticus]|uniref:Gluconate 2-dehydrogenase subunit 3 family protein n=1 Tax=Granulosicoccus antarcticus IMCC3135 TaxID=1192854 RepID=A0A2Z2P0I8_9GAMM|nr:hypothetical protein [Granulosicoccus antarcticus]ASJ75811.1 hypothetical protein IMCC3135_28795 [Granulosicoccus antarcticus IMCC3135]
MTEPLSATQRAQLDAILDQLIPANPERAIPAAGAAGVGDFIENQRADNVSIATAVDEVLSFALLLDAEMTPDRVSELELTRPESFQLLLRLTYMGYYSRPENRAHVGVAAHPVHPKGYEVARESQELLDELTLPVRARGSVYRQA